MRCTRFLFMETTRRTAARATRFILTHRAGSDTGLFAAFVALAFVGSFNPIAWLACVAIGALLVARGFAADAARRTAEKARVRDYEERMRATYAPNYTF